MDTPNIDIDFIKEWEHKYYTCDEASEDERKYQDIVLSVNRDITIEGTISKETFKSILKWKDKRERVEKAVRWASYDSIYKPRFQLIISDSVSDNHKLLILIWDEDKLKSKLPVVPRVLDGISGRAAGFGVPVASTVLHFIFPTRFPIVDIRTAEVLYFTSKIKSADKGDYRIYDQFRSGLLKVATTSRYSLHAIDRALFGYHKYTLQLEMDKIFKKRYIATQGHEPSFSLTLEMPWKLRQSIIDELRNASCEKIDEKEQPFQEPS